ncbi:MAG: glycosyltransferase family 4 protein [Spirosomataceae bacterium]
MNKILIAALGFYPEPHGIAQVAYRHALALHALGYQITVVTRTKTNEDFPFKLITINQKKAYQSLLKTSDADVIFFHGWHNWTSEWAIEVFPLRGKTVLISHGTNFNINFGGFRGELWWWRKRWEAFRFPPKMHRFDYFVFLSDQPDPQRMSDVILAKKLGISNYTIIPNGARPSFSHSKATDFFKARNIHASNILLCVSNFHYAKGQGELLRWFLDLDLTDTALVLVGSKFNTFSERLKKLAGNRLNKAVFLLTQLKDEEMVAAYTEAILFVSATYTEVQPLVLLDAMTAGLPFLCRNVGAVSTLEGGLCFKNDTDFKQKVVELLGSASLRKKLGKEGKEATQIKYNWEKIGQQYHQLIQQLTP